MRLTTNGRGAGRSRLWTATLTVLLSLTAASVEAQPTATLRGSIVDAQGGAVPQATIVVTDTSTGLSRTAAAAEDGTFVVPNLPPSPYHVVVTAPGFADATWDEVILEVGQTVILPVTLSLSAIQETVVVGAARASVDTTRSVVDAVIPSTAIERLPLNGRNFLELALLVPGNAPAPNFDPTKSNTVTISSAGQLGRGGNVTIDGADNNDDVVGGPLQNVTQESVQEFQIATNRFTAETGRSASSVINVVTRAGGDELRGSASFFARHARWQGLPATYDRTAGTKPPFDRQQFAAGIGGPLPGSRAFWFGAAEYRNQDGAVLVGTRDVAARTIRRSFAPAPLDDLLGSARVDWRPDADNTLMVRYAESQPTTPAPAASTAQSAR